MMLYLSVIPLLVLAISAEPVNLKSKGSTPPSPTRLKHSTPASKTTTTTTLKPFQTTTPIKATSTLTWGNTVPDVKESVTEVPLKVATSKFEVPSIDKRIWTDSRFQNRTTFKWIDHKHAKLARERDMRERGLAKRKRTKERQSINNNDGAKKNTKLTKGTAKMKTNRKSEVASKIESDNQNQRPGLKKACPECESKRIKEQMENNRRASLKQQLIKKLKINSKQKFRRPVIPQEILRRSKMEDESDVDDDVDATTTDILVFGRDITNRCRFRKSTGCFKFNLRRKITGRVTSAELFIYKLHDPNDGQQTIFLQELERPKHRKLMPRNIVSRVDTDITEGWLTFRLDKTVLRWAQEPLANDGLAVKCKTCAGKRHNHLFSAKEGYRPFLVVHIQPIKSRQRQRRSVTCGEVVHSCCKHDFWVNFEEINLYQVIHPKGVWANYCTGPCGPMVSGHYNHTALLQDVRWRSETANNTIRSAITPCCGAVRLRTISLLYVTEDGDINRADVPNLQLAECGCL